MRNWKYGKQGGLFGWLELGQSLLGEWVGFVGLMSGFSISTEIQDLLPIPPDLPNPDDNAADLFDSETNFSDGLLSGSDHADEMVEVV